ncbi:MAG: hypothetical protein HOJ57_17300 [Lentisphaerae bacterium]|jgi:hypothetical protein|nr:hypothetical protein [Lentisphaerota bacterium]MBT5607700.1 hypothetical protein [Lentisphaerota bacterium]
MTLKEQTVRAVLREKRDLWFSEWKRFCLASIAEAGRAQIASLNPLQIDDGFVEQLAPAKYAALIDLDAGVQSVSTALTESGAFRSEVNSRLKSHGTKLKRNEAEKFLPAGLRQVLSANATRTLGTLTQHDVYCGLADLLAKEMHGKLAAGEVLCEETKLSYLCLCHYLTVWELLPKQLLACIRHLSGVHTIGALLLGMCQYCSAEGAQVYEAIPAANRPVTPITGALQQRSCFLQSLAHEAPQIAGGQGFLHRMVDDLQAPLPADLVPAATNYDLNKRTIIAEARDQAYRQYEYYALLFGGLGALEFLLRSSCPEDVARSRDVLKVVRKNDILTEELAAGLNTLYGKRESNLRNRALHGVYFDIEARRMEIVLASGHLNHLGVPQLTLSCSSSWPEYNALAVVDLAGRFGASCVLGDLDTAWASDFMLDVSEISFAKGLACDILASVPALAQWHCQIGAFLKRVCPALCTPMKLGLTGWSDRNHSIDQFPRMLLLALLLEPCIRMTLQFLGADVLEQRDQALDGGAKAFGFQYKMLDSEGLLAAPNLALLTQHLPEEQRPLAEQTLVLATKTRDALAHGAVMSFSDDFRTAQGHLVVKSIQLLSSAAAASPRWERTPGWPP